MTSAQAREIERQKRLGCSGCIYASEHSLKYHRSCCTFPDALTIEKDGSCQIRKPIEEESEEPEKKEKKKK